MASEYSADSAADDMESVKQLQHILHEATELMVKQVLHEDVVIFIGTTKSGKSTLINYLLGNSLVGVKRSRIWSVSIQKSDNSDGPRIGGRHKSETIIPTRWENPRRLPGLAIWDTPGFDDNRGNIQDITNAFYVYKLFERIKSVKIVLVADILHIINEPINPFLSLLKSVENLLQERMRDCFSSIVVIFTKVDETIEINGNFLEDHLQPILSNSSLNMSQSSRDFLHYLTQHNENVGFFKQPNEGPVTDDIEVGITEAIRRASSVPENILKNVLVPSIADSSKVFLYKCRDKISSVRAFNNLQRIVCETLQEILENYSQITIEVGSRERLHDALEELYSLRSQIDQVIDSNNGFCEKINGLEIIHPKIEGVIKFENLVEKSKLMEFIDKLLDLKESKHFDSNLQTIMMTAKSKVEEITISMKLKLNQIDTKEANSMIVAIKEKHDKERLLLIEELENIRRHNEAMQKRTFSGLFTFVGETVNKFTFVGQAINKFTFVSQTVNKLVDLLKIEPNKDH